jgi:Family of unknown function (DUF5675)
MHMTLKRTTETDESTIGELLIDGEFECFTLEDPVRVAKIKGRTAIPADTYKVVITRSPRFKKDMPRLLDVPNFDGILIHIGNTAKDTEGCILVGQGKGKNSISQSKVAFEALFNKLSAALKGEETVTIEIIDAD